MNDVDDYDSHEAWLARQHEILALIQETIDDLPGGPPEPPHLPALPLWQDGRRVRGEAVNAAEHLDRFTGQVAGHLGRMFRAFFRSAAAPVFAVLLILWCLFALGALLYGVTDRLL